MSGAFNGLSDIVRKRVARQGIGFGAALRAKDDDTPYLKMVTPEDLIHYGFESEFVGRLPVITVFDKLGADDLYAILKHRNSTVINGKKRDFRAYGIDLRFEDDALRALAEAAYRHKTGARGLVSVVENVLMKFEKKLPSTTSKRLVVTKAMIDDPAGSLRLLLESGGDRGTRERYKRAVMREKQELRDHIIRQRKEFPQHARDLLKGARLNLLIDRVVLKGSEMTGALGEIAALMKDIRDYEQSFFETSGIRIIFDDRALVSSVDTSPAPLSQFTPSAPPCRNRTPRSCLGTSISPPCAPVSGSRSTITSHDSAGARVQSSAIGSLALGVASQMAGGVSDALATPAGIAAVLQGRAFLHPSDGIG